MTESNLNLLDNHKNIDNRIQKQTSVVNSTSNLLKITTEMLMQILRVHTRDTYHKATNKMKLSCKWATHPLSTNTLFYAGVYAGHVTFVYMRTYFPKRHLKSYISILLLLTRLCMSFWVIILIQHSLRGAGETQ